MNNHTDYAERFRKRIKNIENLKSLGPRKSVSQHNLISVIGKKTNATWIDDDDDNDDDDDDDDDDNEDDDYDAETFVDAEEINTNFVSSFFADKYNILLLLLLNTLQSIPVGLSASIPFLLKSRSSYAEQAQFSLSSWPFHLRLLWAPFIEHSHVIKKFERRKSWLILTQYLIGLNMLYLSHKVNSWLNNGEKCEINLITIFFLILNFLSASQDMAISGWALAVLKKRNASYLSTCSRIGNLAGYFIGHVLFLLLESPNFCNSYLRSKHSSAGIVSLEAYLFTTSWIFIFCTTFFAIFKKENHVISPNEAYCLSRNYCPETVQENYNILFSILKLKPVYSLILMLLMSAVGFAVCESITPIKLLEAGVTIEDIAVVKSMNILVQLFLPLLFSNYTTDRITVHSYFVAYSFRLLVSVIITNFVWVFPNYLNQDIYISYVFRGLLIFIYLLKYVTTYIMIVATLTFFTKISDPSQHCAYIAILNTSYNFSTSWIISAVLWLMNMLTVKTCTTGSISCNNSESTQRCIKSEGQCVITVDGYYIGAIICTLLGTIWLKWVQKHMILLDTYGVGSLRRNRLSSSVSVTNIFTVIQN